VTVSKDGPVVALLDENDNERTVLVVLKEGPALMLLDENGKTRALLGTGQIMTPDGKVVSYPESSLILFGPDGKVLWSAP
jgi:hypothetical protein